ncbi:hypothetical protein O181_005130 [Austropuccinia psidii MF-1]|uniref:Reverse transcriptase n=1 Tax=Austropuccinia psidii MF-1 TaxID=1389203 RepID=A0A9Q3GFJ0_9BASI|nr:hypothetical protein [Austropuccinia psidii MF-1]
MDLPCLDFHASLEEQWDEEEEPEEIETVLKVVPPAYNQYLDVFPKVKAEKLPPHSACDHHIKLEGLLPPVGVIYSLSNQESGTLQAYLSENSEKGFIRPSSFPTGEPVLFVKKKDGGLSLCVDYRKLNAVTRKNRYPFPPMNQILTVFNGSTIFSKIDLCGSYNLLRIKEGEEHLTAFRTKYGSYEYLVMPFGLTNATASFQNHVNDIFSDLLDIFVVVYLDDLMVFSSSEEEHVKHVASVLQRLRDKNLLSKDSKCVFHSSSVEYLGYVVPSDFLKMDSSKVQQILNWSQTKKIKALQSFLGFANFYCHFIKNYFKKITALTSLLKKDSPFIFNEEALSQFQILKEAFTTAPILSHFNPSLPTILETDASDYAWGAVLSQAGWPLYQMPCHGGMTCTQRGGGLRQQESSEFSSCNQARWNSSVKILLIKVEIFSDLVDKIQKEVWKDKDYKEILKQLARGESVADYSLEPQAKLLLLKDRVVIPSNEEVQLNDLQKHHESPLAGHPGQKKTLKLIKRNKNIHHKKFGLLKPLQIPYGPWNYLSIDFITQFPLSNNFDSILVVVDRFSKMAIFIPAYGTITAPELAQIFIRHVFSKHVLPVTIVSDRGYLFISSFWTNFCQKLNISRDISTAFHAETDGKTERVNQILEQYLWMYVSYHQDDWHTWLPLAEFAYNNAEHSSTKQSPFFTIYGRNPRFDLIHISQDSPAGKLSTKLQPVQQAVKEELESEIRIFKKYSDRNSQLPPPPVLVEEQEEWEVAQVLDSKLERGKLWYLVEWNGFSEDLERTTWEPASNLTSSPDLVKNFHPLYPENPGPITTIV